MRRARKITRKPAGNDASVTQQYAHSGMSCGSSEESSPPRRRSYRVDCLSSIGFEIELLGLVADSEHRLCAHAQRLSLADRFQGLLINHNKHRMYFAPVESLCTKSTPIRPHALPNSRSLSSSCQLRVTRRVAVSVHSFGQRIALKCYCLTCVKLFRDCTFPPPLQPKSTRSGIYRYMSL